MNNWLKNYINKYQKIQKRKDSARLKGNIWAVDLDEMGLLSPKNKNIKYLL